MPELYIITGSNGAGKSSIGPSYLPDAIRQNHIVFDGDKLFMSKQKELWGQGIKAHKEAKKLAFAYVEEVFEQLVNNALLNNDNFVYEGHFTNEATWDIPRRFKESGYIINLLFLGVTDPELSELRVIDRAKEGGHYVQPITIKDNFYGNLEKLDRHFTMFDIVQIVDTSEAEHKVLCVLSNGQVESSVDFALLPDWFRNNLKVITEKIITEE